MIDAVKNFRERISKATTDALMQLYNHHTKFVEKLFDEDEKTAK